MDKPYIQIGQYRHYEGSTYQVFGVVQDEETAEWRVSYGKFGNEYTCPYNEFMGIVEMNGRAMPRYRLVERVEVQ